MTKGLPTKSDFLQDHGCLDAQEAWTNFGGLTLAKAYAKFCDRPEVYQEDFMFMGGMAFAFYYPVIERYLRKQLVLDELGDYEQFSILACGIRAQIDNHRRFLAGRVLKRIASLTNAVLQKLENLDWEKVECSNRRTAVIRDWNHVANALSRG